MSSKDSGKPLSSKEVTKLEENIVRLTSLKERSFMRIQRIYDMIKNVDSNSDARDMFLVQSADLEQLRERFETSVYDIYHCNKQIDSDVTLAHSELDCVDDLYYKIKLCMKKLQQVSDSTSVRSNNNTGFDARPRLPKLELFVFDGNIENFTTFYETFCSLVHNQTNISSIDKFHYLLSCTRGSALNIVKSVPITSNNYDVVWKALLDKYQDERLLVGRYLDKMINFTPLAKESPVQLNIFIENFEHTYKAIEALKVNDLSSYILCHIALRALDPITRRLFEQKLNQKSIPTFDQLIEFVHNHIKVLEHSSSSSSVQQNNQNLNPVEKVNNNNNNRNNVSRKNYAQTSAVTKLSCVHCGGNHMIYRCHQFRKLNYTQRISRTDELKLCHNCLKPNHSVDNCNSQFNCFICEQRHNVLLHCASSDGGALPAPASPSAGGVVASSCHSSSLSAAHVVLLGTALIHITDAFGNDQLCRVLIDSGAQSNFITVSCMEKLGLSRTRCPFNIYGLAGETVKNHGMVSCVIKPRIPTNISFDIDAVILSKITCKLPTVEIPENIVNEYNNLVLADPYFHKCGSVDLILGSDIFPHIYDGKKIVYNSNIPVALGSVFGYVITGKLQLISNNNNNEMSASPVTGLVSYTTDGDLINDFLKRFWEIESTPCEIQMSPQDALAEEIYCERFRRLECGRYVAPLLLDPARPDLGDSYNNALRRFLQLERRLARAPHLSKAYIDFMREYESLGHMGKYSGSDKSAYIIPHHCVERESTTTPVRVVFDGSCSSSNGVSLNDTLLSGRSLHNDIIQIITNFRLYDICFTSDIAKMYRQVLIDPSERKYQHILWRESPSDPLQVYQLNTNTYGLRSAPFVAVRTLHQLAHDERTRFPRAARLLLDGAFVDDVLWSTRTLGEACALQDELMDLLKCGGFDLRKWASNAPELLSRVRSDLVTSIDFQGDTLSSMKVLGLKWIPKDDYFTFNYSFQDIAYTKRSVLKLLASIFDPIGFLSPCTFVAKCIMQDLWKSSLGWDEQLPLEIKERWTKFVSDLPCLSALTIERHVLMTDFVQVQLIGFCDASTRGYGACLYLRSCNENSEVKVNLLMSKTKVAPIKPLSIPRLELMAAVLLSKLVRSAIKYIKDINLSIIAFTDSSVSLAWLQTPPYKLKTFVSNRVSEVVEVIPSHCWYHVSSENNAADVCSRGALPSQLVSSCSTWLHGPHWLTAERCHWPITTFYLRDDRDVPEIKSNTDTFALTSQNCSEHLNDLENIFQNYSSFKRLQRVVAWCFRFYYNTRREKSKRVYTPLTTLELKSSHDAIIKTIQNNYFYDEINLLRKGKGNVPSLRNLAPFVDSNNFLRVGGRITQSHLSFASKHPLLLPKKCHITKLLIEHYHITYLHVGPRTLQGIICKTYWIVSMRSLIRSILSKCIVCFKNRPNNIQPIMGTLPSARVRPGKVFSHVGCDLGGPFIIKESLRRNAKTHKAYLCLFVCFATKAVHLEVLSDLTAECFLATLDRFIARRGMCSCLYSDCGTNFVAAGKHLKEIFNFYSDKQINNKISDGCTSRQIDWRYNPPAAPHMGGLWEAGIKSAKYHLYRAVGDRALTFEELTTLFCKVEAILNSRPLCSLSDDPNEFEVLTAGHFLVGESLLAVPEGDLVDVPQHRLSRWQCVQKASQSFWKRWSDEYLHTLQQRAKWCTSSCNNIKVGDLVIIKCDLSRPLQWPVGRVEQVHPGPDHKVRVATVRTKNGLYKRPIVKLCPLPIEN